MKKLFALLTAILILAMVGCGPGGENPAKATDGPSVAQNNETASKLVDEAKTLYTDLQNTYSKQKDSYDEEQWAEYTNSFISKLEKYREKVKTAELNRDTQFNLGAVIGSLAQTLYEYSNDLKGEGNQDSINEVERFVEKHLIEAEKELK